MHAAHIFEHYPDTPSAQPAFDSDMAQLVGSRPVKYRSYRGCWQQDLPSVA
jgi:hypothetical protein